MSTPRQDDRCDTVDEEAALPPLPREISFKRPSQRHDDDTVPSELSHLIALPSTLTPHDDNNCGEALPPKYESRHPFDSLGSPNSGSRKAFQLAAMLGMLALGVLFGGDFVYMNMMSIAESSNINVDAGMDSPFDPYWADPSSRPSALDVTPRRDSKEKIKAKAKKDKAGKKREEYEISDDVSSVNDDKLGWEVELDVDYDDNAGLDYDDDAHEASRMTGGGDYEAPKVLIPSHNDSESSRNRNVSVPEAYERCSYVIQTFDDLNMGVTDMDYLREKYTTQSVDANVFYRATA